MFYICVLCVFYVLSCEGLQIVKLPDFYPFKTIKVHCIYPFNFDNALLVYPLNNDNCGCIIRVWRFDYA